MLKKSPTSGPFGSTLQKINERKSVWNKGHQVPGKDPDFIRTDDFGNVISYLHFNNAASEFGWTIGLIPADEEECPTPRPLHYRCSKVAS